MASRIRDRFYTIHELGKTRRVTPEGFLVCEGVAIARTGQQRYSTNEMPDLEADEAGEIRVDRPDAEVFSEKTLLSFEGKPVTVEHPDEFVTPANWQKLAVGVTQNVRRGTGIEDDLIMADLLITDAGAIAYVNNEKPELSAGYDAEYDQTEPGRATQRNIIGNHVALVDRGRAGPRVAIRDSTPETSMKFTARVWDRLMKAVQAKDESAIREEMEGEEGTADRSTDKRLRDALDALDEMRSRDKARDEAEKKEKEEEEKKKAEDKNAKDAILEAETASKVNLGRLYTGDSFQSIVALAEILAPGIKLPTFDSATVTDVGPKFVLQALTTAAAAEGSKEVVHALLRGRELVKLTGDSLLDVFNAAGQIMRAKNNGTTRPPALSMRDFSKPVTPADLNKINSDYWSKRA